MRLSALLAAPHWLPHGPQMVGVRREMPPDTGTGAELCAVIGHGPRIEVMRTDHPVFRAWIDARANRRDAFFIRPAGGADICNLLPVRSVP